MDTVVPESSAYVVVYLNYLISRQRTTYTKFLGNIWLQFLATFGYDLGNFQGILPFAISEKVVRSFLLRFSINNLLWLWTSVLKSIIVNFILNM